MTNLAPHKKNNTMKKVLKTIGQIVNHGLLGGVLTNKNTITGDSPMGTWDKPALAGSIFSSIVTLEMAA